MKKKLFFLVVLLVTMVAGAWGDPVTGTVDFVAKSRSTYENGTFTTANNAGNGYALAVADLSVLEGIADATTVKLEFDVQINTNDRLYMAIGDKTVRGETANGSSKATYNTEGLMMYYGSKDGTYLYVNGTANGAAPMGVTSHVTFTFNRGKVNTYSYTITNKETSAVLFSATNQVTDVSNATIVEAYSWNNSQSSAISAVSYSYEPASEEPAEPEPTEPEGWPKVWDFSTFPSNAADYESYTSPYNYNALICVMPYSTSTKDNVVSPADYITKNGFHANGTSSASNRYMMYTPAFNGKLTVTFKSNNTSATDRITAIGTAVKTFNKNNVDAETVPTEVLAYAFTNGSEPQTVSADLTAGTKYYIYLANGGQTITKLQYDEAQVAPATFAITVADGITNGTVTVDKTEAAEGEEVTVTATPADGYELDAITVTGKTSNQAVTVTDGKFTMIADAVTVSATFKAHVHEFVLDPDQSSEPSCTEPGKTVSVCICGEKEEVEIPAFGHIIGENGICTVCGYNSNQSGTTEKGWLLTTPDKLATGDIVVIVDQTSSKAMSNDKGTTNPPAAEDVNLSEDKSSITDKTVAANIQWVVTVSEGSYQFNVKGTENYLYVTATNNGVRVGAGDRNAYSIVTGGDNGGYYLYNLFIKEDQSEDKRYVGCYNEADWRCYTSINSNIKGNKNAFYKKVGEDAVATPEISGMTPFVGSTTVTITCETQDASIYYTTDGTDPTNESTAYVEPFELTATATVKAIAYDVTGANSDVASKEFVATPTVANIAALNALEDKTAFAFTGEALVVAKAANENKTYVYIEDETGSSLIYDNSGQLTEAAVVGKTIAANWTGKVSIYKNLFEAVPDAALSVKDGEAVEVTYPEAQLSDVKADNVNQVVELKGVTYTLDGKALTISQGQAEAAGYNQFGLEIAAAEEGKTYNIVGAIGRYNDNIQFWPISIEEAQTETAPLYVIGDMNGWSRTAMIEMEFNAETQAYEYSFTNENEFATFAFATYQMTEEEAADDPQWSTFNAEYRWAIGDYDIDASDYVNGDAVQLVKGTTNGTVKLPKGTYTVIVNPETMMMTITGTITPKPTLQYDAVYAVGNGTEGSAWMNGENWTANAEANKMTKVEGTDHLWEITFKDVTAGEYKAKFAIDGTWDINFGGSFLGYGFETNAEFNSSDIVFTTTAEKQDITLRIDLSNCDPTTYEGATFTVIAPAEHNTHVVAGCVGEKEGGADDELFGKAWDGTAEANQLAYDATSKLYTKTYEAVTFEAQTQVKFKIVINGKLWVPAEDQICEIPDAGTYDITVTYNAETGETTMTATLLLSHDIAIAEDIEHGSVATDLTEAKSHTMVTITVTPDEDYELDKVTVKTDEETPKNVVVTQVDETTYTFEMPDAKVTVSATFIHVPVYKSFAESEVFIPTSEAVADAVAAYWVRHGGNFTDSKKRYITPNLDGDVTEQTSNAPGVGIKKGTAAKTFETYVTNVKTIYAYVSSTSNGETRLFYVVATPTDGSEALTFTKEVDNQTSVVEMTLDATKKWKIEYIGYSTAKDDSGKYKLTEGKDLVLHGLKIISAGTDGINGINASKFADGAWYTTGGVRVDQPTKKGLYIHNGRKVVIK